MGLFMANINIEPWRSRFKVLIIVCFIFFSAINNSSYGSREIKFKWDVEYIFWAPDCIENFLMGINGQFPGPTISARAGDTIVVELTNKLHTEGLVIHWHGITQFGTPWADGTASISQCAINPGESFVYRFKVDKPGTYFYHGHYGMQRSAGLYGSLIVDVAEGEKEPFDYFDELNLLLSDWWHKSVLEKEIGLSSKPTRFVGEPQSLLINGKGQYNCSLAAVSHSPQCTFTGQEQCSHQILHVIPLKTYRLRITSTASLVSLNLAIGKHKMVVVEADGNYVEPFAVDNLDIHPGETYSVLIRADQNPMENYWISVGVRGREVGTPQALTVLNYNADHYSLPNSPPPITPKWNDYAHMKNFTKSIMALMDHSPKPPTNYDRRIVLLNTQNYINGFTKWAINNISLLLPPTPYLGSIKYGLTHAFDQTKPPDNFPNDYDVMKPPKNPNSTHGNGVYFLSLGTTVDVVLQNANELNENQSAIHPWHLHGHDFWVMGYGEGRFSEKDVANFNLKNPPLRNTAVIFPYGWTALRFVADNPGVWAFHCHIEAHLHMGMGVVFAEGVHSLPEIPHQALACGLTAKWFMSGNHT